MLSENMKNSNLPAKLQKSYELHLSLDKIFLVEIGVHSKFLEELCLWAVSRVGHRFAG